MKKTSLVVAGLCALFAPAYATENSPRALFSEMQSLVIDVSNQVLPSVVHVEAIIKKNNRRTKVNGSGFFIAADGYIVTNEHVVANAEKIEIGILGHKGKLAAEIIGTDKLTDLALLKLKTDGTRQFPAARLGDDSKLRVGEWVLAIGNPYGLDGTVSLGIVSAKGRNLQQGALINEFIQTDAMIDFGSSGGPLINLDGDVVGINSLGQGRGIGFTIPISTVKDIVKRLQAGDIDRGWLGVGVQPLSRPLAKYYGHADLSGVIVTQVLPDSPAAKQGLKAGDVIVSFGGQNVHAETEEELNEFRRIVAQMPVGQRVGIEYYRELKPRKIEVVLARQPKVEGAQRETDYGFNVEEITPSSVSRFRLKERDGVYISYVEPGSPAAEAGLEQGDVIKAIDKHKVFDLAAFELALQHIAGKQKPFLVTISRGEALYFLLVRPYDGADNGNKR